MLMYTPGYQTKGGSNMNPQTVFCPNLACAARGQQGQGNIGVHSRQERRYRCEVCGGSFSATKGTLFYRLRTDSVQVMLVIALLAYGCPLPAIVKAFGFDERTVKEWWRRSGEHCRQVHEHMVEQRQFDLQQVQADEIKAKVQGGSVWLAMAMMVSTRLWLGGVISPRRDYALIEQLVAKVRGMALCRPLLLAVDGLVSYVGAFQAAFRSPLPRHGQPGRPQLVAWPDIVIVQVVKQRTAAGLDIMRRIVQGSAPLVAQLLHRSQGGGVINTAYIERLNATFRQRLACLARRTRCLAQQQATLTAGMYVVGCFYNFCDVHESLRLRLWITPRRYHWVQRTPAMAANLTDHCWTPAELLTFKVPPPPWTPPPRRGPRSKQTQALVARWCS
jgi:transposase-like protein